MADDDGVIIPCRDPAAELFPVGWFKVLFGRDKDICRRVQAQEVRAPLLRQVVGHDIEAFLGQTKPLGLHTGGDHLVGLAGTDTVGQKGIVPVEDMGDRVFLVLHEGDLRRHAHEPDMAAIILPGAHAVIDFVVPGDKILSALHILKDPLSESVPDQFLLLLGQHGLLAVEDAPLGAVFVPDDIVDLGIPQVQGILQKPVPVDAGCAKGIPDNGIPEVAGLAGHLPLAGDGSIFDRDLTAQEVPRRMKSLPHELGDVRRVDPGCSEPHFDFRGIQLSGLNLFQGFRIHRKAGICFSGSLCGSKLLPDIPGKVLIRSFPVPVRGVFKDDAFQVPDDLIPVLAAELFHVGEIHPGFFPDGDSQSLTRSIHGSDRHSPADRPLGENIRLPLQLPMFIQDLEGAQETVRGILGKSPLVRRAADQAESFLKAVIVCAQLFLQCMDGRVVRVLHLQIKEAAGRITQADHPAHPVRCHCRQVNRIHPGVLTEIDPAIYLRKRIVPDGRVCQDALCGLLNKVVIGDLGFRDAAFDPAKGLPQTGFQVSVLKGQDRCFLLAELVGFLFQLPQDHLRMQGKVGVDLMTVRRLGKMCPFRHLQDCPVPFLEKEDVSHNIRAGISPECIVGKADGSQEVCPRGDIPADRFSALVHGAAGGDHRHNTSGAHQVQGLGNEIIMDQEILAVVAAVGQLIVPKWNVPDDGIEEAVRKLCLLKALGCDGILLVKLPRDPCGDPVQFYAVHPDVLHAVRNHAHKIADAAGRLKHVAARKAHPLQRLIHAPDHHGRSVEGIQSRSPRRAVFLLCEYFLEFRVFG